MELQKLPRITQIAKISCSLKEEETLCDATDILENLAKGLAESFDDENPKLAFEDPDESISELDSLTFEQIQDAITVLDTVIGMLQASKGLKIVVE